MSQAELIQRLRREGENAFHKKYSLGMWKLCSDAADEIERLNRLLADAPSHSLSG